jgi:hypothetical protein
MSRSIDGSINKNGRRVAFFVKVRKRTVATWTGTCGPVLNKCVLARVTALTHLGVSRLLDGFRSWIARSRSLELQHLSYFGLFQSFFLVVLSGYNKMAFVQVVFCDGDFFPSHSRAITTT